jgi:hypothetical protein
VSGCSVTCVGACGALLCGAALCMAAGLGRRGGGVGYGLLDLPVVENALEGLSWGGLSIRICLGGRRAAWLSSQAGENQLCG